MNKKYIILLHTIQILLLSIASNTIIYSKEACPICSSKSIKDMESSIATYEKTCKQLREELLKIGKNIFDQSDTSDSLAKWIKITADLTKQISSAKKLK